MRASRKWLIPVILISLLGLLVMSCAPSPSAEPIAKAKTIKVGSALILTGPNASSAEPPTMSSLLYLRYVNDTLGGIEYTDPVTGKTDKVKLDLIWEDCAYQTPKILNFYKKAQDWGAQVLLIHSSTAMEALAQTMQRDKIFVVGNGTVVTPISVNPWMIASGDAMADEVLLPLPWIKESWKESRPVKVGVMTLDIPTYRPIEEYGSKYAQQLGGIEWLQTEFVGLSQFSYTVELQRMANKGIDWLLVFNSVGQNKATLDDMIRLGIRDKIKVIEPTFASDDSIISLAGQASEGLYLNPRTVLPNRMDIPGVKLVNDIFQKYSPRVLNASCLYEIPDAMFMIEGLRLALNKVGYEKLTQDAIREGIYSVKNLDTKGLTPNLSLDDPKWPCINPWGGMAVIKNGVLTEVAPLKYKTAGFVKKSVLK